MRGAGLAAWLLAAACATSAGTWAVSLIAPGGALTEAQVQEALATASAQPPPPPGVTLRAGSSFAYPEGSLTAACSGGRAVLLSWTPAQNHNVDDVERGPAPSASVTFESADDRTARVTVRCPGPVASVVRGTDD
ncbi:hypothetical protein [Herbidospora cretacea]|uniref:hypothetical protein n=1 Tax=Herbidospora cretacea TaxID=28444 RepID=UPI00068F935C|nr:hypothetical protein [Herbidospora cretacea]